MEHVKRTEALKHQNSPQCTVYEYPMENSCMNVCIAEIAGRYPAEGYALNHTCNLMGYVIKGSGKLVTDTQQVELTPGDALFIPAGERYFWEGELTLALPSSPAWHPDQYKVEHIST